MCGRTQSEGGLARHLARHTRQVGVSGSAELRVGRPRTAPARPPRAPHELRDRAAEALACPQCSLTFRSVRSARDHARTHEELVQCGSCDARVSAKNLPRHMEKRHARRVRFSGNEARRAARRTAMKRHEQDSPVAVPVAAPRLPQRQAAALAKFLVMRAGPWRTREQEAAARRITPVEFLTNAVVVDPREPFKHDRRDARSLLVSKRTRDVAVALRESRSKKARGRVQEALDRLTVPPPEKEVDAELARLDAAADKAFNAAGGGSDDDEERTLNSASVRSADTVEATDSIVASDDAQSDDSTPHQELLEVVQMARARALLAGTARSRQFDSYPAATHTGGRRQMRPGISGRA